MPELILLSVVILIVWRLAASGSTFVEGFSQLLERPVCQRPSSWSLITRTHRVDGEYEGRPTELTLTQDRTSDMPDYLIVGMEAIGATRSADRVSAFPDAILDSDGRRALYDLVVKHDVTLALEGRWLKATWGPVGFTIFPGHFDPERWRNVLRAMRRVVQSLEDSPSPPA